MKTDKPTTTSENAEQLPPIVIFLFLILIFIATAYFFSNTGSFSPMVFDPHAVSRESASSADPLAAGRRGFIQNCAICHQESGEGLPGQFPPLAGSEWVLAQEPHGDNHMVGIVLHGLQGPVTVKGQQFNNVMVPWADILNDDQIAEILTYVRSEWGNQAGPISPAYVAKIREETKGRREAYTVPELLRQKREEAAPSPAP